MTLRPGDLVVATEVTDGHGALPRARRRALLAGELRRAGLAVRTGPVVTRGPAGRWPRAGAGWLRRGRAGRGHGVGRGWPPRPAGGRWRWSGPSRTPRSGRWCSPAALAGGLRRAALLRAAGPALAAVGGGGRPAAGPAGRAAVVLRRGGAGHRDRRAGCWTSSGAAGVRAQADRAQHPRGGRPGAPRRGLRGRARRGARTARAWCSPRTASPPPCARRPTGAAWPPWTPPARWWPRCTPRRAGSPRTGYLVALIGHAGHEEVEGTLGEAPEAMALVETAEDVARAARRRTRPRSPTSCRPRSPWTRPTEVVDALRERFPAARAPAATTSATPPPTGSRPCAPWPPSPTWCWWPGRRTHRTRCGWWRPRSGPGLPAYLIDGPADIELGWLAGVVHGRPHRRGVRAPGGGGGDHRRPGRAWPGGGQRAGDHRRIHPIQPAQGGQVSHDHAAAPEHADRGYLMRQKLTRKREVPAAGRA